MSTLPFENYDELLYSLGLGAFLIKVVQQMGIAVIFRLSYRATRRFIWDLGTVCLRELNANL